MGLSEIKTLDELLKFLPALSKLFDELDGFWEADMTKEDFVAALVNNFNVATYYGIKVDSKIVYFISVIKESTDKAIFWLFYVNKDSREHTKNLLSILKSELKSKGVKHVRFTTSRITRSYDRWVSKFGAEKHLLTYKLEL